MPAKLLRFRQTRRLCHCELRLASGERVLVAISRYPEPSFRVIRLAFFGLISLGTLWEYRPKTAEGPQRFMDLLCNGLVASASIEEVQRLLPQMERAGRVEPHRSMATKLLSFVTKHPVVDSRPLR